MKHNIRCSRNGMPDFLLYDDRESGRDWKRVSRSGFAWDVSVKLACKKKFRYNKASINQQMMSGDIGKDGIPYETDEETYEETKLFET